MVETDELPDDPFNPVDEPTDDPAEASGTVGSGDVASRLFDGSAHGPSVQELEGDYGLGREWSIALRGLVRAATGDGIPPVAEILMGSVLGAIKLQRGGTGGGNGEEDQIGPADAAHMDDTEL